MFLGSRNRRPDILFPVPGGHLFLSHSGADSLAAAELVTALRARGLGVWFDKDSLPPGDPWQQAIEQAIADASGMLVYVGANGVEKWVEREVRAGLVRNTATPAAFPLIPLIAPGGSVESLPPFLSQHQAVDVSTPQGIARLIAALQRKDAVIDAAYWRDHSPFRGLQTFEPPDAWLFFGRDQETKDLLDRLNQAPVVAVLGNSGSGKSSLVRAGLIPTLRRGRYQLRPDVWVRDWRIAVFRPTSEPFRELAERLLADLASPKLTAAERKEVRDAVYAGDVRDALLRLVVTGRVLLVADQFEEVFTQVADSDLRRRYTEALLDAARTEGDLPVHVVLAMRADFYPRCLDHTRLKESIERNLYGVSLMPRTKLREAVINRLALAGRNSGDGLVDLLLEDVGDEPGNLALLEHALDELWSKKLSADEYAKQRGLAGVLARHADAIYGDFKEEPDRKLVEKIFVDLVQTAEGSPDTRRLLPKNRLLQLDQPVRVERILDGLATGRLITISGGVGADAVVEVSHEALIRDWPALRGWVDRDRADIQMQRRLEEAASRWRVNPRETGLLLRGKPLADAAEWLERHPEARAPVPEFLKASRKEAQRELRVWRVVAAALVMLLLGVSAAGWYARRQQLVAESRELAAEAERLLPTDRYGAFDVTLRAWERSHTVQARDALIRTFTNPAELRGNSRAPVVSAAFSLDGEHLVTAGYDNAASVWRAPDWIQTAQMKGHASFVESAEFSPDGVHVVTASADGTSRVWDTKSGREVARYLHAGRSAAFLPDGQRVVSVSGPTAHVWHVKNTDNVATKLEGHSGAINATAFSVGGRLVVTASDDSTARVWDAGNGRQLAKLEGHSSAVLGIAFSPDGERVVTASSDGTARVWDASSRRLIVELKGHTGTVCGAYFAPDGRQVLTGSKDGTARLWDARDGRTIAEMKVSSQTNWMDVAFSADGRWLLTRSEENTPLLWSRETGRLVLALDGRSGRTFSAKFSPDGQRAVTASEDATARVWNIVFERRISELKGNSLLVTGSVVSPDGLRIVTTSSDGAIRAWDVERGTLVAEMEGFRLEGSVYLPAFSADGRRVVTVYGNRAEVWEVESGRLTARLEGHSDWVLNAAFSPDGRTVVTSSGDKTARVWDVTSGKQKAEMKGHSDSVRIAVFSPDGQRVVTGSDDKTARVWDVTTQKQVAELKGHLNSVLSAAFSSDGLRVVTTSEDKSARVWDVATQKQVAELRGYANSVRRAVFSLNQQQVVTASDDRTARVWDAANGNLLRVATMEDRWLVGLETEGSLFTESDGGTVRVLQRVSLDHLARILDGEPVDRVLGIRR